MCSITALVHLRAAVLFFLDISGSCGYSIAQQAALFHSIKSLFMNKPLIIVRNKTNLQPLEGIYEDDKKLVMEMKAEALKTVIGQGDEPTDDDIVLLTETGVISVKNAACERLSNQRVEMKMKSKKLNDCLNRFHVAMPKPRNQKERPPWIPQAALEAKQKKADETAKKEKKQLEKDLENENGGAGVYSASLKKHYILANDKWKEDIMPEILDGHNVYDFIDPDILSLEELEQEESLQQGLEVDDDFEMDGAELSPEEQAALAEIRKKKSLLMQQHRMKKSTAELRPTLPRKFDKDKQFTSERMGRQFSSLGIVPTMAISRARSKPRGRKRERSLDRDDNDRVISMEVDGGQPNKKMRLKSRSLSRSRSKSQPPGEVVPGEGFNDTALKKKALKMAKSSSKKRNKDARIGEADRVILSLKPKHLFSGKRTTG